jgi:hypothetical protein
MKKTKLNKKEFAGEFTGWAVINKIDLDICGDIPSLLAKEHIDYNEIKNNAVYIICENKKSAQNWLKNSSSKNKNYKIIKVKIILLS